MHLTVLGDTFSWDDRQTDNTRETDEANKSKSQVKEKLENMGICNFACVHKKKSLVLVASDESTFEDVCSVASPFKMCQLGQGCEPGVSSGLGSPSAPPPGPSRGEPGRARGCGTPPGRGPALTQHPSASPTPGGASPLRPTPPTPPDPSYPAESPPRTARSSGAF